MTFCAKTLVFAVFIIFTVNCIESSQKNEETWSKIFETSKKIYQLQSSRLGFMAPKTRATLKELVEFYETAISQAIAPKKESLFKMVKEQFKDPPLTDTDIDDVVEAYEAIHKLPLENIDHAFLAYMKYLTLARGAFIDEFGTVFDRTPLAPTVPLKFDKEVYELCYIIQRVLLVFGHSWSIEYEQYKHRLNMAAVSLGVGGGNGDLLRDMSEGFNLQADDIGRSIAEIKQEDGRKRAKDILNKAEMDLGQNHERTIAVAKIIASLYDHVGMTMEAREIQKRFNLDSNSIKQKNLEERTEL